MSTQTSEVSIKIGCNGDQNQQEYQNIDISITMQESKLMQYNKSIQDELKIKRTPVFVLQVPSSQSSEHVQNVQIFGYEFQTKEKVIGTKKFIYGDVKNQERALFLKKIQRALHLITQISTSLKLKCEFYNPKQHKTNEKVQLTALLNKFKAKGILKLDEKTYQTFKKTISKISPKFVQSPVFMFFEIFQSLNCKLDLQSLQCLQKQSQQSILKPFFNTNRHNPHLYTLLKANQQKPAKLTICLQKLISFQLTGPSFLVGLISLFL